jgi:hypothetical protein
MNLAKANDLRLLWLCLKETQAIRLWYRGEEDKECILIYPESIVSISTTENWPEPQTRFGQYINRDTWIHISKYGMETTISVKQIIIYEMIPRSIAEELEMQQILEEIENEG